MVFTSTLPRAEYSAVMPTSTQPRTRSPVHPDTMSTLTQADIGNMAVRVGGSVLSGMRSLGELAFTAARSRMSKDSPAEVQPPRATSAFFSRSAPAASDLHHRRHSHSSPIGAGHAVLSAADDSSSAPSTSPTSPFPTVTTPSGPSRGHYVTVLDLQPLLSPGAAASVQPEIVAKFLASKKQLSSLQFSEDGASLMVVPEDGQTVKVYQMRPSSRADRAAKEEGLSADPGRSSPHALRYVSLSI